MKHVTVVGAGAIGSAVALQLAQAGHPVTVVARGERLAQLQRDGAIVTVGGARTVVQVSEALVPTGLIIVPVRAWQVEALLPSLRASDAPVMFMFNQWDGLQALRDAVGRERFGWGFPAIIAALRDGRLDARVVPRALERLQITTIGALRDFRPPWLDGWAQAFTRAGIPTVECSDMEAWLATHAALMTPMMAAGVLARSRGLAWPEARAVVDAWREGFGLVRRRGLEVTPSTVEAIAKPPRWFMAAALWLASRLGGLRSLGQNGAEEPRFLLEAMGRSGLGEPVRRALLPD